MSDGRIVPAMLLALILIVLVFWLLGAITNVVGAFVHILLAVALVLIAYRFLSGRRAA
jgi:hypothetical protein